MDWLSSSEAEQAPRTLTEDDAEYREFRAVVLTVAEGYDADARMSEARARDIVTELEQIHLHRQGAEIGTRMRRNLIDEMRRTVAEVTSIKRFVASRIH